MAASESSEDPTTPGAAPATSDAPGETVESAGSSTRGRRILVQVLIWGTTVLAVVAIFAVWANRQLFNPDNWANTSTRLLQNEKVRNATANYLVDQLYANVDVAGEIKARLPAQLQPLAAPAAGALQNSAIAASQRALADARVQEIWKQSNRAADQSFIDIVNGGKGAVQSSNGTVTLDLSQIIANITNRLGLPDVSSKLPPSAAHLTVLKSDDLKLVQNGGKALKGLALLLTILVPVLYALAIVLARGRRRKTLMTVGIAIVFAGVIVLAGRSLLESQTVSALVKSDANRPAASEVVSIATSMLSEIAGAFVIVGIPLILAGWFAGPARLAVRARRAIAPFLREQPGLTFAITGSIMLLIFIWRPIPATGRPAGIIVFLALAFLGTEVLRRQTAREFPEAPPQTAS
jgi:hypothetical protein